MQFHIRPAIAQDADELCELINEIIAIGGTTAHQKPFDANRFRTHHLVGEEIICCFVAQADDGSLLGFQCLKRHHKLPDDWGDISTFAKVGNTARGVGSALFEATSQFAREKGFTTINATIRADNSGGLRFYSKIGFVDYKVDKDIPLSDGTLVDKIAKKYLLSN